MKYDTLNSDYLSKNPTWHVEDSPWKAEQILKLIKGNKLDFTQICEVGCGVGDLIIGKAHKRAVISLVDRKSLYTLLRLAPSKEAPRVSEKISRA
jgi:IS30 family transposase